MRVKIVSDKFTNILETFQSCPFALSWGQTQKYTFEIIEHTEFRWIFRYNIIMFFYSKKKGYVGSDRDNAFVGNNQCVSWHYRVVILWKRLCKAVRVSNLKYSLIWPKVSTRVDNAYYTLRSYVFFYDKKKENIIILSSMGLLNGWASTTLSATRRLKTHGRSRIILSVWRFIPKWMYHCKIISW